MGVRRGVRGRSCADLEIAFCQYIEEKFHVTLSNATGAYRAYTSSWCTMAFIIRPFPGSKARTATYITSSQMDLVNGFESLARRSLRSSTFCQGLSRMSTPIDDINGPRIWISGVTDCGSPRNAVVSATIQHRGDYATVAV